MPPGDPAALVVPPLPPMPQMYPLLTKVTVSLPDPPIKVSPGVSVLLDHRYIPLLIVIVTALFPALYPDIVVISSEAFCVLVV